jgi:hypothetical protein
MGSVTSVAEHTRAASSGGGIGSAIWIILAITILVVNFVLALAGAGHSLQGEMVLGYVVGQVLLAPLIVVGLFLLGKRFRTARRAAMIFFFTSLLILPSLLGPAVRAGGSASSEVDFGQVADEANRSLPQMVDEETELTSVESLDRVFVYNHTMVNFVREDLDVQAFAEAIGAELPRRACSTPEVRDNLLARGQVVRYRYVDKNGERLAEVDVDISQCTG